MKALILAAGFGKRLLPYTSILPKPLFPVGKKVLIDIIINQLKDAGVNEIIINLHHLHKQIDSHINSNQYGIPVSTRFEPKALETGGAIKNVEDFWDDKPFIVINSDIITDINIKEVYKFHILHGFGATLVLHDCHEFNKVIVNKDGFIRGFDGKLENNQKDISLPVSNLAFTGIQVIDPSLLHMIPKNCFYGVIELYKTMIKKNIEVKAFISKNSYWKDLGTQERYKEAILDKIVPKAFTVAFSQNTGSNIFNNKKLNFSITQLDGDASSRVFQRIKWHDKSMILTEHGITCQISSPNHKNIDHKNIGHKNIGHKNIEFDSFLNIGRHLKKNGIPVPEIYNSDRFSGLVLQEDLGGKHLQDIIISLTDKKQIIDWYKKVIDALVAMSINGYKEFNLSWPYQTCEYSQDMIIKNECYYFIDSFLNGYLNLDIKCVKLKETKKNQQCNAKTELNDEFILIAKGALESGFIGFMHRDFHSRNIMVKKGEIFFIDFQGGRKGPVQYDLASLLIDPYVKLSLDLQEELLDYCIKVLLKYTTIGKKEFISCFNYCAITRNLQMLGAFGYLSKIMNKIKFEQYIPTALQTLKGNIKKLETSKFPILTQIITNI